MWEVSAWDEEDFAVLFQGKKVALNLGGWLHLTVGSLRGKIEGFPALGQSSEEAAGPRSPVGRRGGGQFISNQQVWAAITQI